MRKTKQIIKETHQALRASAKKHNLRIDVGSYDAHHRANSVVVFRCYIRKEEK